VTEHADLAIDKEIIQRHEIARELMMNRRNIFAKQSQLWITVTAAQVAQNLIVGAILFDNVKTLFDRQVKAALVIEQR
jgi:hypothetical protein